MPLSEETSPNLENKKQKTKKELQDLKKELESSSIKDEIYTYEYKSGGNFVNYLQELQKLGFLEQEAPIVGDNGIAMSIMKKNNIKEPTRIQVGQKIYFSMSDLVVFTEKYKIIKPISIWNQLLKLENEGKILDKQETIIQIRNINNLLRGKNFNKDLTNIKPGTEIIVPIENIELEVGGNKLYVTPSKGQGAYSILNKYGLPGHLSVGIFQTLNNGKITGDLGLKVDQKYILPIIVDKVKNRDSLNTIISRNGLNEKYLNKIFEYNKKYNLDFKKVKSKNKIFPGISVFIPKWETNFYIESDTKNDQTEGIWEKADIANSFNFDKWIDSIEVVSNELKGEVFIIDPGHGGKDPGSTPIARNKNGKGIEDKLSTIKIKNKEFFRVKPGRGNNLLHVYESATVMDVSYRLSKFIKQHGGEINITHYNHGRGIVNNRVLNISKYDKYTSLGKRTRISNGLVKKDSNAIFLSIHADTIESNNKHRPILFHYYKKGRKKSNSSEKFAEEMARNIDFRRESGKYNGSNYHVIRENKAKRSLLIELGNIKNEGDSWLLRTPEGRQDYAEALGNALIKTIN